MRKEHDKIILEVEASLFCFALNMAIRRLLVLLLAVKLYSSGSKPMPMRYRFVARLVSL